MRVGWHDSSFAGRGARVPSHNDARHTVESACLGFSHTTDQDLQLGLLGPVACRDVACLSSMLRWLMRPPAQQPVGLSLPALYLETSVRLVA
mmetsp:Transcript_109333/g.352969  ORF Transcript_109333/g.352969 Transcript_109333/m.352969 type:complete len:92 (-) Transcript_109333:93-368(-)